MPHLADEPEDTRPANPWPRLLALGAALLLIVVSFGVCLVSFVNTGAEPALRLRMERLEPGVPRFEPVTRWGADRGGFTYGALVVQTPSGDLHAFFSRNVDSGCNVQWLPTERVGDVTGVYRDHCTRGAFTIDGAPLGGTAPRSLDQFAVTLENGEFVVDLRSIRIGRCVEPPDETVICERDGPITRSVPLTGSIPADFARR